MKRILSGIIAGLIACLLMVPVSAANKQEVDPATKVISKATATYTQPVRYITNYSNWRWTMNIRMQLNHQDYFEYVQTGPITVAVGMGFGTNCFVQRYENSNNNPMYGSAGASFATLGDVSFTSSIVSPNKVIARTAPHGTIPGLYYTREDGDATYGYGGKTWFYSQDELDNAIASLKNYDFTDTYTYYNYSFVAKPDFKTLELQNCVTTQTIKLSAVPVTINGGNYSGAPALQLIVPIDLIQNIQGSFLSI